MQRDDQPILQEFHAWLQGASAKGYNNLASDETVEFVPSTAITAFFATPPRLKSVLRALFPGEEPDVDVEVIRQFYLKTLCILISIGRGRYIQHFHQYHSLRDTSLGWSKEPPNFPKSSSDDTFASDFSHKQWEFYARVLQPESNAKFEKQVIWPIFRKERIRSGVSADIYKIHVHKAYNKLRNHPEEVSVITSCLFLRHSFAKLGLIWHCNETFRTQSLPRA